MPKNLYSVDRSFEHGRPSAVGVLVVNLGTPEAPTAEALNPYLKQFLWDPRVIELSRPVWWMILNFFVLTTRPKKSAELYAKIWTEEGSPLMIYSQSIVRQMEEKLQAEYGTPIHVALGMTYGEPSVPNAMAELKAKGCDRLLIFPLYSHYSSSSTGASMDAVMKELMTWRRIPELRSVHQYHDDPAYIRALADSVRAHWAEHGQPDKLVTSYHGIPKRYFLNGDPYHCQCHKTTRLLVEELELPRERYEVTFQSLFGREEWLQPYTDVTLEAMARSGIGRVDVMCPGFAVDCLETIDEIGRENRHVFMEAGGKEYHFIPCLNDRPQHVELLTDLMRRNLHGWAVEKDAWDAEAEQADNQQTRRLADAMAQRGVKADAGYGEG